MNDSMISMHPHQLTKTPEQAIRENEIRIIRVVACVNKVPVAIARFLGSASPNEKIPILRRIDIFSINI